MSAGWWCDARLMGVGCCARRILGEAGLRGGCWDATKVELQGVLWGASQVVWLVATMGGPSRCVAALSVVGFGVATACVIGAVLEVGTEDERRAWTLGVSLGELVHAAEGPIV